MTGLAELRPGYEISRVIRGNWQLAGGHGAIDEAAALDALEGAFDAGLTTFDCADIYTGVEALIGAFRNRLAARRGAEAARALKVHTKLVPDLDRLPTLAESSMPSGGSTRSVRPARSTSSAAPTSTRHTRPRS